MKYPWLYVGAKVVCVDASSRSRLWDYVLKEGEVYTLRWVGEYTHSTQGNALCVRLVGIERPNGIFADTPFAADRFAPAYPSQQDHIESLKRGMDDAVRRQREHA